MLASVLTKIQVSACACVCVCGVLRDPEMRLGHMRMTVPTDRPYDVTQTGLVHCVVCVGFVYVVCYTVVSQVYI